MGVRRKTWMLLLFCCALLIGVMPVAAQTGGITPIEVGENHPGELIAGAETQRYAVQIDTPQNVEIQVLALTRGFAPAVRIIDPQGIPIVTLGNPTLESIIGTTVSLLSTGEYLIEVTTVSGIPGQYVLSLRAGDPLEPPEAISLGEAVTGIVNRQDSRQAFIFPGAANAFLLLNVQARDALSNPALILRDGSTGEIIGMGSPRLAGVRFRIPPGLANYLIEVMHSGSTLDETFFLCLEAEGGAIRCPAPGVVAVPTPTPLPPTPIVVTVPVPVTVAPTVTPIQLPTLNPNGPCTLATNSFTSVNVRSGPGLNFSIRTQIPYNLVVGVIGRLPDNSWWQVNVNGILGWVSGTVTRIGGNCAVVPVVLPPTATPTNTLPATLTPTATYTNTTIPQPTATPTPTETQLPPSQGQLDPNQPPISGSTALTSGFVPDPFTVGTTGGGMTSAASLGGSCTGWTNAAPNFSVNYTAGAFPTLRFYFVGNGDSTMIIRSPSGGFFCVDDSFGTLNPTIDFNSPASGRYDIWIGSFSQGGFVSGTLYVTENTGNHP